MVGIMGPVNVNLYELSRVNSLQKEYCKAVTRKADKRFRLYEFEMLKSIVGELQKVGTGIEDFEGFAYSFSIPYISCELDILKIDKDNIAIDIELKSDMVSDEKIAYQLKHNRNYLLAVARLVHSYTIVKTNNTFTIYYLNGEELKITDFDNFAAVLKSVGENKCENYSELFKPSDYLVSPINTPERFLEHKYFLTEQQENIKKSILEDLNNKNSVLAITGKAGTGKTLLLYDIAMEISKKEKIVIIHCGKKSDGQRELENKWDNATFPQIKYVHRLTFEEYNYFFIDEAQRLTDYTYNYLQNNVFENAKGIIFSYDNNQVLSEREKNEDIPHKIEGLLTNQSFHLTNKIRTNEQVIGFIKGMLDLNKADNDLDYNNITVLAANDIDEAKSLIRYYENAKGYTFINCTPSNRNKSILDEFDVYQNSHEVIGQEFDNVMIMMDKSFRYENRKLQAGVHPNPNYLYYQLIFQAVSRARIKLCILVYDNYDLLEQLLKIKNKEV